MTNTNKCSLCKKELKPFYNMFVCYPCEQAYYINDENQLDYYANLGEFIPLTRRQRVLTYISEEM